MLQELSNTQLLRLKSIFGKYSNYSTHYLWGDLIILQVRYQEHQVLNDRKCQETKHSIIFLARGKSLSNCSPAKCPLENKDSTSVDFTPVYKTDDKSDRRPRTIADDWK